MNACSFPSHEFTIRKKRTKQNQGGYDLQNSNSVLKENDDPSDGRSAFNDGTAPDEDDATVETDALAPEEETKLAEKMATRHDAPPPKGFVFVKPGKFEIEPEEWSIEKLQEHEEDILSYFLTGPDPFDSTFFYKQAVVQYLRKRFPRDKPIRDIIDSTTSCINENNRRYVLMRKTIMLALPLLTLFAVTRLGTWADTISIIAGSFLLTGIIMALIQWGLRFAFVSTIEDLGKDFHSTFQQFSNVVFNNFKESLYLVDQDEHTTRPEIWPAYARRRIVGSLWQSKRVEYAEKYLMVKLHTAKNGFRGMFGSDLMGNIINLISVFLIGLVSIEILQSSGHTLSREYFFFASKPVVAVLAAIMSIWMISYFARKQFGNVGFFKAWGGVEKYFTWGAIISVGVIDIAILISHSFATYFSAGGLLAVNVGTITLLSFKSSIDFSLLDQCIDSSKWRKVESFAIHKEIGDQIYRDKRRIVEEKHRQKDSSHKPMEFDN
jgi:hypothetical protein